MSPRERFLKVGSRLSPLLVRICILVVFYGTEVHGVLVVKQVLAVFPHYTMWLMHNKELKTQAI